MKPLINNPVKYFITGFIVLLFMSLSLFWIRFTCEMLHYSFCHNSAHIHPSGLVPTEIENDPNVTRHSIVSAHITPSEPVFLGVVDYFVSMFPGERHSSVYYLDRDNRWIYFDKKLGLLVCRYSLTKKTHNNRLTVEYIERYVGPEGISEMPNKPLGRFIEPIFDSSEIYSYQQKFDERILYDKKLRQFFKIDFDKQAVIKGPKIKKHDYQPIQIGRLTKNTFGSPTMHWQPPKVPETQDDENSANTRAELEPILPYEQGFDAGPYLLVLDITGRIDLLNTETLELDGIAGRLPEPETYFSTTQSGTPKSLLDYIVQPIVLNKYYLEDGKLHKMTFGTPFDPEQQKLRYMTPNKSIDPEPVVSKVERKYLGMAVSSVSRSGTALALTVFNAEGKQHKTQYTKGEKYFTRRHDRYIPSSKAVFWEAPWAPVATIVKYSAENLHPPILSILSYFTTESFEAGSGHRALFILPNSFIAMKGRDMRSNFTQRLITALLLISPSIILSLILSWRISKDAKVVGLSNSTQLFWLIATISFGIVAYITYRLTRPNITLVTCQNCGRPRRPDMDLCHRCKSKWDVPELTPPAWCVLDK